MKHYYASIVVLAVIIFLHESSASAQNVPSERDGATSEPAHAKEADKIALMLTSQDAAQVDQAIKMIQAAIKQDSFHATIDFQHKWMQPLSQTQRFSDIAELCKQAVLARPYADWVVDYFQSYRVQALLKAGKADDAVSEAKSLFNVVLLKDTAAAIQALADALTAAHPNDTAIVDKFKDEETKGADDPAAKSSVLASVKVSASQYEDAMGALTPRVDKFGVGKANLLLLADRPTEAEQIFQASLARAKDEKAKTFATGDVAKAMKAEDGTIARANKWLDSK